MPADDQLDAGAGLPRLAVDIAIDNRAKDHRLLALFPHSGDALQAEAVSASRCFQVPLLADCQPVDMRKFQGGRPALQDSSIDENFYRDDPWPQVRLPRRYAAFTLGGADLQVTAWKKSWGRSAYILRFFNASPEPRTAVLPCRGLSPEAGFAQ